jgi:predicted transcriptional regulator
MENIAEDEITLDADIQEGLADIENGRVHSHESVMAEIKSKYNYLE